MKNFEFIGSAFWLAVGLLICEEAYRINLGNFHNPGPGFLPFGAGLVLAGLSSVVLLRSLGRRIMEKESFWAEKDRRLKVGLTLVTIIIYGLLLEPLGFLLTTFVTMGFLFKAIEPQRWRTVLLGAFLSALGAHLIFQVWLKVELPTGFLGI
jgi:putative tricarboxylic transport membrane protein